MFKCKYGKNGTKIITDMQKMVENFVDHPSSASKTFHYNANNYL